MTYARLKSDTHAGGLCYRASDWGPLLTVCGLFVLLTGLFLVGIGLAGGETTHSDPRNAVSAFSDVMRSEVAVNGERGTPGWRKIYGAALDRALRQFDFDKDCAVNGFVRTGATAETLSCLTTQYATVTMDHSGKLSYFRAKDASGRVVALDVLQQDVHADDYLDIDLLMKIVRGRN